MTSFFNRQNWEWLLLPPDEILRERLLDTLSRFTTFVLIFSAMFSHALADTYLRKSNLHFFSDPPLLSTLALKLITHAWTWGIAIVVIFEILRLVKHSPIPFWDWLKLCAMALVPYHVMLPIALVAKPFGFLGTLSYGLVKLGVLAVVLRRFMLAVENLTQWAPWACLVTAVMPFLLTSLVFLLMILGGLAVLSLGLVAALW